MMPAMRISAFSVCLASLCSASVLEPGNLRHERFPFESPSVFMAAHDLQPGDVILAKGQTGASHAVEVVSRNVDAWTHAGILSEVKGETAFLVHATPAFVGGEGSGVERVALGIFLADPNVLHAAVFRPVPPTAGRNAAAYAGRLVGRGIQFDQSFDLSTRADLYCTELVQRAYAEGAGIDLMYGQSGNVRFLFEEADIILPDQLARSNSLRFIGDLK